MADKIIDPAPVIKRLANRCLAVKGMECTILGEVIDMLRAEPAVDAVEVVHGRWNELDSAADYQCSVCGFRFTSGDPISMFPYCRCGAKMDGDGNG